MAGHLPLAVLAVMIGCAFYGLPRLRAGNAGPAASSAVAVLIAIAVAAIFGARFFAGAWFDPVRDGDIAWQQWLGLQILHTGHIPAVLGPEAFTAPGAPWVPQEWALSLLVAVTLGTPLFLLTVLLTTAVATCTLWITVFAAYRLRASAIGIAFAVTCVAFSMIEPFGVRAQVFAWLPLAGIMYFLRCAPVKSQWWIVPIVVVWANVHASAVLAPAVVAIWTLGLLLDERGWTSNVRQGVIVSLSCFAAVLLTPLGLRLPEYAIQLFGSPIRVHINEWQPADMTATSFVIGSLPLVIAVCILGVERSRRWRELLIFATVTWMTFTALRNVPVCAIVLAPAVAERLRLGVRPEKYIDSLLSERPVRALLYGCSAIAAVLVGISLFGSSQFTHERIPVAAIAKLHSLPGTHNLYCEDFSWCSQALQYANMREFIDGRCDPFPLPVWRDYETVVTAKGPWQRILDRRQVTAMVVERKNPLDAALPKWHAWRLVYQDPTYRLFVRN